MAEIPDEIWTHILQIGVDQNILNFRDLCAISISSRRLSSLSNSNSLWKFLWAKDFPYHAIPQEISKNFKSVYKQKFEIVRSLHKRLVLRVQSQVLRECKCLETMLDAEKRRLNTTSLELENLERARQSSVALKIWQLVIVLSKQQNFVEQTKVHIDSRIHSLKMEINGCRKRIDSLSISISLIQSTMERVDRELKGLTYKPFQDSCNESVFQVQPKKPKIMVEEMKNLTYGLLFLMFYFTALYTAALFL